MEYRKLPQEEYDDLASRILYEDNHLIIINKKSGEIVQGDKTGDEPLAETLKAFIAQRDSKPGKVFLGVPHRLDRPVSGIAMFAKTSKSLERLNEMFRTSGMRKFYLALVCSEPQPHSALLEDKLYRIERQNKSYVCKPGSLRSDAKTARLEYSLAGRTERYFLVRIKLLTGRHHQIRCQMANIGCPVKGDLKYGAPRSNPDGSISLHAWRLEFMHPVKKEPLAVEAPVPASWKGVGSLPAETPEMPQDDSCGNRHVQ